MPKEIPQETVQKLINLIKEHGFYQALRILNRDVTTENLRGQGVDLSRDKAREIWDEYLDDLIIKLYPGKTLTTLLEVLGLHGIYLDRNDLKARRRNLIEKGRIDPTQIKEPERGRRGPYRTSRQFKGVPHKPLRNISLRKKPPKKPPKKKSPPKRRPGK